MECEHKPLLGFTGDNSNSFSELFPQKLLLVFFQRNIHGGLNTRHKTAPFYGLFRKSVNGRVKLSRQNNIAVFLDMVCIEIAVFQWNPQLLEPLG